MTETTQNPLCQLEFRSRKLDASLLFFKHVLGWPAMPMVLHEYVVLKVPSDSPYGISLVPASTEPEELSLSPQQLIPYFRWEELDSLIAHLSQWGGKLISGPQLLAGYGKTVVVQDPGGIQLGFFVATSQHLKAANQALSSIKP